MNLKSIDTGVLSDLHKDVRGFRPGPDFWAHVERMTESDYAAFRASLETELATEIQREHLQEVDRVEAFELQVTELQRDNGITREAALRWIAQAEAADSDDDLCYLRGLPYGYFRRVA